MKSHFFAKYCWFVLTVVVFVILWGAVVRATGSGAGCGNHWPLCNGEVIPPTESMETLIEFTHRLSSGLLGILVLGMLGWAFRVFPARHVGRWAAIWSLFFITTESVIGAGLVKFEWVAADDSMERVYTIAFHLINTFLLLGTVTLTAWFAAGRSGFRIRKQGIVGAVLLAAFVGSLILGASGAITALGDTLISQAGLTPAESPVLAWLVSLRITHPLLAFVVLAIYTLAVTVVNNKRPDALTRTFGRSVLLIYTIQLCVGGLNVYLKAPVWMQIVHLLLSNLIWILLVLLTASALSQEDEADATIFSESLLELA